jgi:hypothetical protein
LLNSKSKFNFLHIRYVKLSKIQKITSRRVKYLRPPVHCPERSPSKLQFSASVLSAYCPGSKFMESTHNYIWSSKGAADVGLLGGTWCSSASNSNGQAGCFCCALSPSVAQYWYWRSSLWRKLVENLSIFQNDICKTQKKRWWYQRKKLECNCLY